MDLQALLREVDNCSCGKKHTTDMQTVEIRAGVVHDVGRLLADIAFPSQIHIVADKNTIGVSKGLLDSLDKAGIKHTMTLFDNMRCSDMAALRRISEESRSAKGYLAVGTGSINDLAKLISYQNNVPYAVFATAPSTDGFASTVSAITESGYKKIHHAHSPVAILADSDILAFAPADLKAAGYADIIGKYSALVDWRVASLLTGEYYCESLANLTLRAVKKCRSIAAKVMTKEPETAGALMEALVYSGMAMQLCGSSRPASGAEHQISHFWEMIYLRDGRKEELHSKKVGVAAVLVADCYHQLSRLETIEVKRKTLDYVDLRRIFGENLVGGIVEENTPDPLLSVDINNLKEKWGEVRKVLSEMPSSAEIAGMLKAAGAWTKPIEAGIGDELAVKGVVYGRYVRRRLTVLKLSDLIANFRYSY